MAEEISGAAALIETLSAYGVDTIFGMPGEETTDLMAAIAASDIEFVLCRHEQGAAFMASVHGRLAGKPAACLSTLGPGATNLVTGVADANLDHVPLIAITGQGGVGRLGRESHQIIDLARLFEPVTKYSRTIYRADDVQSLTAEAFRQAVSEKPGAVHLSLPEDVAAATTVSRRSVPALAPKPLPSRDAISAAAKQIRDAKQPIILAGAGVLRSSAAGDVRALCEATGLPLASTFMAKGVLPDDHPQSLMTVGQPESDHIDRALEEADLVIAIGFDPVEYDACAVVKTASTRVVTFDEVAPPGDTGWNVAASVTGDLASSVSRLTEALDGLEYRFSEIRQQVQSDLRKALSEPVGDPESDAFAPQDICRHISAMLCADDIVLSGVGLHKLWVARHLSPRSPGQVIIANGLAGMGMALPGAMAAAHLRRDRFTLAICGDGDFLMNVQEMETATRLGLPLTVMVWEDGGLALIDEHQRQENITFPFGNPRWADLARSFDWEHIATSRIDDLEADLKRAAGMARPVLLTLRVDYAAGGGMPGTG